MNHPWTDREEEKIAELLVELAFEREESFELQEVLSLPLNFLSSSSPNRFKTSGNSLKKGEESKQTLFLSGLNGQLMLRLP